MLRLLKKHNVDLDATNKTHNVDAPNKTHNADFVVVVVSHTQI